MSWLGLDCGAKRTGVALSYSGQLAEPLTVVTGSLDRQVAQILDLVAQHNAATIVVGLPPRAGRLHPAVQLLAQLRARLGHRPVSIESVDETLTSKEAERLARGRGGDVRASDRLAAQLILEQYLGENPNNKIQITK